MKQLMTKGTYLAYEDGTPFFLLGDTAWELAHKLNREEAEHYFATRQRQGFEAAQIVALAEFNGLRTPNAYGRVPFLCDETGTPDPLQPDESGEYSYWAHLDYIIDCAAAHHMFVVLLPTWGDKFNKMWGEGPEVFTTENAGVYAAWLAVRYKDKENVIWMLGGDRPLEEKHKKIIDAMAAGIRAAGDTHLITFHPCGCQTSCQYLSDADYIDMHSAQTGHGTEQCYDSDKIMLEMRKAGRPYYDSEPRYEDHPACFDASIGYFWDAADVRLNAYRDVLAGACGHTYGNHSVWSMTREPSDYFPFTFKQVLCHPGAEQIHYVKALRMSRDYFSLEPADECVRTSYEGAGRVTAAKGDGYLFAYTPLGLPFTLEYAFEDAKAAKASWFDPRTGKEEVFTVIPPRGKMTFAPVSSGKGCDWVLILDKVKR